LVISTRAGRLAVSAVVCAALVACSKSQPGATPSRPSTATDPLPAAIADVMNSYTTTGNVRAIIVNVNGRTRFERYYSSSPAESRNIYSVTESVTSTLVGIALSEGRLRLNESLSQMLPRYAAEMKPSLLLEFSNDFGVYFAATTCTWTTIKNLNEVGAELMRRSKLKENDADY